MINCSNRLFKLLNQTGCTLLALPAPTHRLTELNSQRSCALLAALEAALPARSATRCHNAHWPAAGVPGEKPADLGTGDHSRALFTPTREALSHSARRAPLEARTLGSRWPSPAPPPSLDGCLVRIATARFRRWSSALSPHKHLVSTGMYSVLPPVLSTTAVNCYHLPHVHISTPH